MEVSSAALEARIQRLEGGQRRLMGVLFMALLLVVALLAWQFLPVHSVVEARRFVVKDSKGRERGEWTAFPDGAVGLRLNNVQEKARTFLRLGADGRVMLRLTDERGVNRLELALEEGGTPAIYLAGRDGGSRTLLRVAGEGGEEGLIVRGADGGVRLQAP